MLCPQGCKTLVIRLLLNPIKTLDAPGTVPAKRGSESRHSCEHSQLLAGVACKPASTSAYLARAQRSRATASRPAGLLEAGPWCLRLLYSCMQASRISMVSVMTRAGADIWSRCPIKSALATARRCLRPPFVELHG